VRRQWQQRVNASVLSPLFEPAITLPRSLQVKKKKTQDFYELSPPSSDMERSHLASFSSSSSSFLRPAPPSCYRTLRFRNDDENVYTRNEREFGESSRYPSYRCARERDLDTLIFYETIFMNVEDWRFERFPLFFPCQMRLPSPEVSFVCIWDKERGLMLARTRARPIVLHSIKWNRFRRGIDACF